MSSHRQSGSLNNFTDDLIRIETRQRALDSNINPFDQERRLVQQIEQWESESIETIRNHATKLKQDVANLFKDEKNRFTQNMKEVSIAVQKLRREQTYDATKIDSLQKLLQACEDACQQMATIKLRKNASPSIPMIELDLPQRPYVDRFSSDQHNNSQSRNRHQNGSQNVTQFGQSRWTEQPSSVHQPLAQNPSHATSSRSMSFLNTEKLDSNLKDLIEKLSLLPPMDKHGPMSGNCDEQTTQMENFLRKQFVFENIPGEEIVHGVRSFRLRRPPEHHDLNKTIYFPKQQHGAFAMTIEEIRKWQRSYRVYAPRWKTQITNSFLLKALQGGSAFGSEAFLMKFVVRISTCPILMEFDARVKDRKIEDHWPHNIKLVSVTGVDFACRIHDVDDVKNYIRNWQEVFVLNPRTQLPEVRGGRDLIIRDRGPKPELNMELLCSDLTTMARIRLQACEREGVQIVVETGIGLGVFSGTILGIDETVRRSSATAIRKVLEQDGPHFHNIKAVVFALPIFPTRHDPDGLRTSVFQAFTNEFTTANYRGPIPVLVIDQDMHRLAVNIAQRGYRVSELNPADSHGVFGEYWQNRGPAVEEKLALTTLGLLVQHHLINPEVLDPQNYVQV